MFKRPGVKEASPRPQNSYRLYDLMLKLGAVSFRAKCPTHPTYNPLSSSLPVDVTCPHCRSLDEIYQAHRQLVTLMNQYSSRWRDFSSRHNQDPIEDGQLALFVEASPATLHCDNDCSSERK